MMHPVFVLLMIFSLLLPAVPVSGCECSQNASSASKNSCCCSTSSSEQTQKRKSCCCQSVKQPDKKGTSGAKQAQCQKPNCHCQQMTSQSAIITSVVSTELIEQLSCLIETAALTAELSLPHHNATALTFEKSHPARSYSAGEFCAQFCLWLI
ncbi:MAG: hypothetical protein QM501_12475 [Gimesia sp.]